MDLRGIEDRQQAVLDCIQEESQGCRDEAINLGRLRYSYENDRHSHYMITSTDTDYRSRVVKFNNHAEGQLLGRLKMPAGYIHRCPLDLQREQINHWLAVYKKNNVLLRWKEDEVRAIFSTRYKPDMDDHLVFPVIFDALNQAVQNEDNDLFIRAFHKTEDFTSLRVVFKNAKSQLDNLVCFAGISIVNSEVGKSSLCIRPYIRGGVVNSTAQHGYDFLDRSRDGATSFRHVSDLKPKRIIAAIQEAKKVAEVGIYRVFEANQIIISNPIKETKELVQQSDFLGQWLCDVVEQEYQEEQEATKLQLAQSMLTAMKTLPLFKQYLAEREVGRWLNLFGDTAQQLELIVNDMDRLENETEN